MPHTLLKRQTIVRLKSRPLCAGPDKVAEMAERVGIEGYRGLVNGYYAAAGAFFRFSHRHIGVCIGLARKITRPIGWHGRERTMPLYRPKRRVISRNNVGIL